MNTLMVHPGDVLAWLSLVTVVGVGIALMWPGRPTDDEADEEEAEDER